ncbi:ubiquitin-related modifier 1 isoform X3 [Pipistrellus kuhlii]|uniref:ubiquitin-related modifier 1 isoform X3 n=1 Tax=Pipistrellus kuhlii TaxID=59472 RepID=UPI001E26F97B|nr:ubiquitin-related modifier 1 isoform X3 [Pipistrellus kuhlii]
MAAPLSVEVEFGGGAELLFDGVKKHQVTLPGQEEPWKYMQTPPGAERNPPPTRTQDWLGRGRWRGLLGPLKSRSGAAPDQFPVLVGGALSPNPSDVTVPPASSSLQ